MADSHSEIVAATADEAGGLHNQKGVEFQRNWAVIKMLALEEAGVKNCLFLFEALQDVTVLDSAEDPKSAEIYQVEKKDRGEWSWARAGVTGVIWHLLGWAASRQFVFKKRPNQWNYSQRDSPILLHSTYTVSKI